MSGTEEQFVEYQSLQHPHELLRSRQEIRRIMNKVTFYNEEKKGMIERELFNSMENIIESI